MHLPSDDQRRDPDALLAQVQEQARRAARGRLRIYFGASAGVGKTCAMLRAAQQAPAGLRVLVGLVESHGRADTEALLAGLALLPRKALACHGTLREEFDLDGALAQQPQLVLVDELAHSNLPGSRHPKRWQDIEELLAAGIDVYTTLNVQHLESLNEVVGSITGIRVSETVPDTVFDGADEVVLVDVPADELLARLKQGKVYQPDQAERARRNFFRKGNLIALRELALRRTAERIGDDVRAYRSDAAIDPVWGSSAALLAAIGPGANAESVVRNGARLAGQLGAAWHAVYVETPALQRLPDQQRARILKALALARNLGAQTAVLSNSAVEEALVAHARSHNLPRIVLGRGQRAPRWQRTRAQRLGRLAPDIDLIELAAGHGLTTPAAPGQPPAPATDAAAQAGNKPAGATLRRHGAAGLASLAMALAAAPALGYLDLANIAMLFLLVVLLVAVRFGRGPSVTATCVGVACFDFFFVPPRFDFAVSDVQYLVTFGVMLAVGLITGQLTAGLRFQAQVAARRESRTHALYEFARDLSGVLQSEQVEEAARTALASAFGARVVLLLPDADGRLVLATGSAPPPGLDLGVAQWAYDHAGSAGMGTGTLPGSALLYMPLVAPMGTRGVLALEAMQPRALLVPEQREQLDTFAALAAIALERVHYIAVAQEALVQMASERLRNSLLAALSHDLRTPLTSLMVQAEWLAASSPPLTGAQRAMASTLHEETVRLGTLVTNLLDMARIESGEVRLRRQWQPIEEVIGSALRASGPALARHRVQTSVAPDLPLVEYDAVLLERVLCNLLENAAKYTPPGSTIDIGAALHGMWLQVRVRDNGPGLPPGRAEALFEKFVRGDRESAKPGVGLGLAICRAIMTAHGGSIEAASSAQGAVFVCALPLGTPPDMPVDDEPAIEEQDE